MATMDALLEASERELAMPSSHGCAQGKDVWTLITNDIDHEKIHTAQVLEARYESRMTASPMERLAAEWLAERARFIGSLIGLTDEQFNRDTAPGQWTYRVVAKHVLAVEQDSLKTMAADHLARAEPAARLRSSRRAWAPQTSRGRRDRAGRGWRIAHATTRPETRVSAATRWIAAPSPTKSATSPESRAPMAYPRSRQNR